MVATSVQHMHAAETLKLNALTGTSGEGKWPFLLLLAMQGLCLYTEIQKYRKEEVCGVSNKAALSGETQHLQTHGVPRCDLPLRLLWLLCHTAGGWLFWGCRVWFTPSMSFCRSFQIRRAQPQLVCSKAQKLKCHGLKRVSLLPPTPCRLEETFL